MSSPSILLFHMEYALDLFVITNLMMLYCPKKNNFVRRCLLNLVVIAIIAIACTFIISFQQREPAVAKILAIPIITHILSITSVLLFPFCCFKGYAMSKMFTFIAAYATRNFIAGIYKTIANVFSLPSEFCYLVRPDLLVFHLVTQIPFHILMYVVLYFCFFKRFNRERHEQKVKTIAVIMSFLVLVSFYLLNMYEPIDNTYAYVYGAVYTICSILIILLRVGAFEKDATESEIDSLQALWHEREEQMALFQENIDTMNIKYHDLKKTVALLKKSDEGSVNELLDELEYSLDIYDSKVETGNEVVDTILSQYKLILNQRHIRLTTMVDGTALSFMSSTDTIALLGNILENVIEATSLLPEDERTASFSVISHSGIVSIHTENPFKGNISFCNGLPNSTKGNNRFHGFGMKSVKAVTEKYCGEISISAEAGIFILNIIFEK